MTARSREPCFGLRVVCEAWLSAVLACANQKQNGALINKIVEEIAYPFVHHGHGSRKHNLLVGRASPPGPQPHPYLQGADMNLPIVYRETQAPLGLNRSRRTI